MSLSRTHSLPLPSLHNYIFAEQLGRGTFAVVYKAFKKGPHREIVAIKCVPKNTLSKTAVDNLINEISITKNIKDKFIVELRDFQWDNDYIYLIFEYCAGGELSQYIKSHKRLPETTVQHFLQQIGTALKVLRDNNISHMDLKPQNILISSFINHKSWKNVTLKIADFGFAQYLKLNDSATSLRGSPLYMAPEMLLQHHYDARVDLWSLGIILYECLFGRAPYSSESFAELAEKIKNPQPILIPNVINLSDNCRDLLTKLLKRDPNDRISFDDFFKHPFVDLEHIPSPENYNKGVDYVHRAVKADNGGDYDESFKCYTIGLQYLVPIYNWGDGVNVYDESRQKLFKSKLIEYIERAETIKKKCNLIILEKSDILTIEKAYQMIDDAESLKDTDLEASLQCYHKALESVVPLFPKYGGKEKDQFYSVVNEWMSKAEEIKEMLKSDKKIKNANNKDKRLVKTKSDKKKENRINALAYDKFISDSFGISKSDDSSFRPSCYVQ